MHHPRFLSLVVTIVLLGSVFLTPFSTLIPYADATPEDWWNTNWNFRKAITINHTKVGTDLNNFPILINITDGDLANKTQTNGNDIVFTDGGGVKLNHEVEFFDYTSGHLVAWINTPLLSSAADTELYMYYGNPDAFNQQNVTGVWDSNYVMVQHLEDEESSEPRYDSTANSNNGTAYGGVGKSAEGKIDGADEFDGVDDYIKIQQGFLPTSSITVELWLKPLPSNPGWLKYLNTGPRTTVGLFGSRSKDKAGDLWTLGMSWDSGAKKFTTGAQSSGYDWVQLVVTWNGSYSYGYYNGYPVSWDAINGTVDWWDMPFYLGSNYRGRENFYGALDEVRISSIARSPEWILTSYNNQKDPSTFFALGSEESYAEGALAPFVSDENPPSGVTEVYTNPVLSASVYDLDGDPMTIVFRTNASGIWENIRIYSNVSDGTYSVIPTNMKSLGTSYYWSVSATDGTRWTNKTYSFTTTTTILNHKWTATGLGKGTSGVLIADVTGDDLEEVIYAAEGKVTVLNGTDGSVIWNVSDSGIKTWVQPQMADLDSDGTLEIIVPLQRPAGLLVLHGNNGTTYWRRDTGLGLETYSSPVIADIDGDGYPTIFFASTDIHEGLNGTGRVTSLTYDGEILRQTFAWRPCSGGLSIADTDGDGEFELYVGDRNTGYGNGTISFWAENLTQRWNRREIMESSNIPMLADVDRDGILDVIAGHMNGGVAVFNSTDGSNINITRGIPEDAPVHYQPSVYDIDSDGNLELLMADGAHNFTSDDIVIWDLVSWGVDARIDVGKSFYGPQIADVTGDGLMEIIAANYTALFIFQYDPSTKNYSRVAQVTNLYWRLNYAVVQDIDGDGYSEVVISSRGQRVYAFDTPARRPFQRQRSEIQFYSERRLGAAEYVPPPGVQEPVVYDPSPSDRATNVPVSISQLSFTIRNSQNNLMNYTVETSPNIGSDNATNVGNGRYTISIGNLTYSTNYTWTVRVTDGIQWTNQTYTFITESLIFWWNPAWKYRKPITFDHEKVGGDLMSFPVLIDITDGDLASKAQDDGDDIVFTGTNNNQLDHEIELYNNATGHLIAWVNVPLLSSTDNTKIYMYYGNSNATKQQNSTAVWDSDFVMVQHLEDEESSEPRYDSTANSNNGTAYGGVGKSAEGKIDGADEFDGVDDYVRVPEGFLPISAVTVELWLRPLPSDPGWSKYVNTGPGTTVGVFGSRSKDKAGDLWTLGMSWDSGAKKFTTGSQPSGYDWIHLVVTWNFTHAYAYYNGEKIREKAITGIPDWADMPFYLGSNYRGRESFYGALDEVRISSIARSPEWILTSYNNQKDPSTFYTFGSEETTEPFFFNDDFDDNSTDFTIWKKLEKNNGTVSETNGRVEIFVETAPPSGAAGYITIKSYDLSSSDIRIDVSNQYLCEAALVITLDGINDHFWYSNNFYSIQKHRWDETFNVKKRIDGGDRIYLYSENWTGPTGSLRIRIHEGIIYFYEENNLRYFEPFELSSYNLYIHFEANTWGDGYFGMDYFDNFTFTVSDVNRAPTIDSYYPPSDPTILEGESQEFNVTYSDPDGDALTVEWLLNGSLVSSLDNYTFTGNYTSSGVYNVTVVVSDGLAEDSHEWNLTVLDVNRPPTIDSYYPSGDPTILEGESQEFNVTYSDLDGDNVTVQWYLNGTPTVSTDFYIFEANYTSAGTHNVTVIITDSLAEASHQWTLTVLNVNLAPEASDLSISPSSPSTIDNLVGSYTYYDADGDPENGTERRWYRNGILQPQLNDTLIVPSNKTTKGEEWYFTVRPKDGTDFGELQTSAIVTIQNSPPSISGVVITPDPAYTNDTLTATPIDWFDADGDNATYFYQWQKYQNGTWENISGATTQTLGPENFAKGEQIKIVCTPYDGQDNGTARESNITISNSPPIILSFYPETNLTIFEGGSQKFNVTCSDLDGDILTIEWWVNETLVQNQTDTLISSYTFNATEGSAGTYVITVIVKDNETQTSHQWTLTVKQPET